jgi:hypothetical protein
MRWRVSPSTPVGFYYVEATFGLQPHQKAVSAAVEVAAVRTRMRW